MLQIIRVIQLTSPVLFLWRQVDFCVKYGYPGEKHEVETKDHYTLTLHRIPYNGMNETADRPVVLLQHGIVLSSDQWVLRGREDLGGLILT